MTIPTARKLLAVPFTKWANTFFFTLFLLVSVAQVQAQGVRAFGNDAETFSKDFSKHLNELMGKKEAEAKLAEFLPYFNAPDWDMDPVQRETFMAISREMLRRRVVNVEPWLELMNLFQAWSWPAGRYEQGQSDRFFKELQREFKRASRSEMELFLHTYTGLTEGAEGFSVRLYDDGKLSWWYLDGTTEVSPASYGDTATFLFKEGRLVGRMKNDSVEVADVEGLYNPITGRFKAVGGRVEWLRAGFGPGELYADFPAWEADLHSPGIQVDSVELFTSSFMKEGMIGEAVPILSLGHFEDRLTARNTAENAIYPRFEAYDKNIEIDDFFEGVDYKGGFSIIGQRFFASGSAEEKARFTFSYDSTEVLELRSERFVIRSDELLSPTSEVVIRLGESDSIYHLKSEVKYDPIGQLLRINRPDEGLAMTPYVDSYHNLVMELDQVQWKVTEPSIYLGGLNMGSGSPMILESDQYFRSARYAALQGLSLENPLVKVDQVGASFGNENISLYDMAVGLGMPLEPCGRFMMELAVQGFVRYDVEKKVIDVLPKTSEYILDHDNRRDYDVIRFVSEVAQGMNARLSLLSLDMEVVGVQTIALSDSQKVALFPTQQKVLIHKGLNFDFDGRVEAGRFTFYSRENKFNYDLFMFNMPAIDSMRFKVPSFDLAVDGTRPLVLVRNTIQDISGELWIDYPTNKSSYLRYPEYPIFKSAAPAKIYYDKAYGGVYKRSNFYVNIDPFTIDSLDNTSTEGLVFGGSFTSAGIFPVKRQDIRVQRDYSLGFTEETGPEGWRSYQGAGTSTGTIQLSIAGLRLNGDLAYQKSRGHSEEFVLFPDSARGRGSYDLAALAGPPKGGGHPSATGLDASMHWLPYQKTWWSQSLSQPFTTYPERPMTASGRLTYQPGSLEANGLLAFNDAELEGAVIRLHAQWLESGKADFRVRAAPDLAWGFQMQRATAMVDFAQEKGHFELLGGDATLSFPRNEYEADMNQADWDIRKKLISIQKGSGVDARMTSTKESQEGLNFLAKRAEFFLLPSILEAYGVPNIDVADSRVFPDSGRVTIEEAAYMRPLKNASLLASRVGAYHRIEKAEFKVRGRNDLFGAGEYQYTDELGKIWPIPMGRIDVDSLDHVVAQGELLPEAGFHLSPHFQYYGIVNMESVEPMLTVRGRIHIVTSCPALETDWIMTTTQIDPLDIVIDLPDPDTARPAHKVYSGIYLMQDSASPYTAFIRRNNPSIAVELISARGILFYDAEEDAYVVTTRRRLLDPNAPDNHLVFSNKECTVTGMGQLSLGAKMGRVQLGAYGHIEHDLYRNKLSATAAVTMDFVFQEDILKALPQEMGPGMGGLSTDWANDYLLEGLNRLMTPRERDRFYTASTDDKLPRELRQTLYFDEVDLVWDKNLRAFRSKGALGVGGVSGTAIHRYVEGVLELRKRRGGDEFSLYLNPNLEHYFFYKRNVLRFYSTEKSYMDAILATDTKKRSLPAKDGEPYYTYVTTTRGNMKRFLDGLEEIVDEDDQK